MAKSMSIKLEFVAFLPQIAITCFTYNAVEFYGPQGPRYKEVDLYIIMSSFKSSWMFFTNMIDRKYSNQLSNMK